MASKLRLYQFGGRMDLFCDVGVEREVVDHPLVEDELIRLYDQLFVVAEQRRKLLADLRAAFNAEVGFGVDAANAGMADDDMDEGRVARALMSSMLTAEGRRRLGINPLVSVDTSEFYSRFAEPIKDASNARRGRFFGKPSDDEESNVGPLPRLDVRGAVAYLRSNYGGQVGERHLLGQVAAALYSDLHLDRQEFEVARGKVQIETRLYSQYLDRGRYDYSGRERLYKIVDGLCKIYDHFDEAVPPALLAFRQNIEAAGPGMTFDLGPALKLRTFKEHIRLTMAAGFAEQLRLFLVEFRT